MKRTNTLDTVGLRYDGSKPREAGSLMRVLPSSFGARFEARARAIDVGMELKWSEMILKVGGNSRRYIGGDLKRPVPLTIGPLFFRPRSRNCPSAQASEKIQSCRVLVFLFDKKKKKKMECFGMKVFLSAVFLGE